MAITTVLVDDDEGLCECLIPVLHDLTDVQVVDVAQTPADAIGLMARHEKDWALLILDIDLRNGSGLAVLNACQKRLAHQEVFVLTNMATDQVRSRCHEFGVDAVFDKTTEMDKFFERCKNLKEPSHPGADVQT
jgi:DNA-binding NarL/FixJ family response regulator